MNNSVINRLCISALDGRVHGCFDSSAYVKGFTSNVSPMVKSQVEVGSFITHINDRFVVGCTFSAVLQLLRQEKRPIKIRFERGCDENDDYAYKGEKPIQSVQSETSTIDLYSSSIQYLSNNIYINTTTHQLFTLRLLLLSSSYSILDNIKFILRRRAFIPTFTNGEWIVGHNIISQYPRKILYAQLIKVIPSLLEEDSLSSLFEVINSVLFLE